MHFVDKDKVAKLYFNEQTYFCKMMRMKLYVCGAPAQLEEMRLKGFDNAHDVAYRADLPTEQDIKITDGFILLGENNSYNLQSFGEKPVIINSVIKSLKHTHAGGNVMRINGWPGFINRSVWEVAAVNEREATDFLNMVGLPHIMVKDEPGLVSARVVSMIINEAFFALKEKVSTKEEIDLAMKLGTNYPFGPFEWADKIGLERVHALLTELAIMDDRYSPSFTITAETKNNG